MPYTHDEIDSKSALAAGPELSLTQRPSFRRPRSTGSDREFDRLSVDHSESPSPDTEVRFFSRGRRAERA